MSILFGVAWWLRGIRAWPVLIIRSKVNELKKIIDNIGRIFDEFFAMVIIKTRKDGFTI